MQACAHRTGSCESNCRLPPEPKFNIQEELIWGLNYRQFKEKQRKTPIPTKKSPLNIPFEICRAQNLAKQLRKKFKKNVGITSAITLKCIPEKITLLDRSVMSQPKYMDFLSKPNPKFYLMGEPAPKKPKRRCELEPCSPRFVQLAVPNKRRVFANWKDYQNFLPVEMLLRFEEILHTDLSLDPKQARNYYKQLDKQKRREKRKKLRIKKKKQREKERGDKSWMRKEIEELAKVIVDYIRDEPLFALTYKQLMLSDGILERSEKAHILKKKIKRNTRHPFRKTVVEICDKCAVWIDTLTRFVDVQAIESDEDIPPLSISSLSEEEEGEVEESSSEEGEEEVEEEEEEGGGEAEGESEGEAEGEAEVEGEEEIEAVAEESEESEAEEAAMDTTIWEGPADFGEEEAEEGIDLGMDIPRGEPEVTEVVESMALLDIHEGADVELAEVEDHPIFEDADAGILPSDDILTTEDITEEPITEPETPITEEEPPTPMTTELGEEVTTTEIIEDYELELVEAGEEEAEEEIPTIEISTEEEAKAEPTEVEVEAEAEPKEPKVVETILEPPPAEKLDGRIIKGHKPSVTFEHDPNAVCCLSLKTWAVWLLEITHNAHNWTKWIGDIIRQIREFAATVRGDIKNPDGTTKTLKKAEWRKFCSETLEGMAAWKKYSEHVKELSKDIIENFHNKKVYCCPKCLEDHLIPNVVVAHKTLQSLTEAITCADYWQRTLDQLVEKSALLVGGRPKEEEETEGSTEESDLTSGTGRDLEECPIPCHSKESSDSVFEIEELDVD